MASLTINGTVHEVDVEPDTPLLWVIREQVGLTGTKYSCGIAQCGACTVHVDGVATRSCTLPVSAVTPEQRIVTIEGLSPDGSHPVQKAVRLLPDRPDYGGGSAAAGQSAAERRGYHRGDDQHLPLRHLQ